MPVAMTQHDGKSTTLEPGTGTELAGLVEPAWLPAFLKSPSTSTLLSIIARLASMTVVLAAVLARFDVQTAAVWLLFTTVAGLQIVADLGFNATFVRLISFARSGAGLDQLAPGALKEPINDGQRAPDFGTIAAINNAMRTTYGWLSMAFVIGLLVPGTWAVSSSVGALTDPQQGWIAWSLIVAGAGVTLYGFRYSALLHGLGYVAIHRRWEALVHTVAAFAGLLVAFGGGGLLALVTATQLAVVLGTLNARRLCRKLPISRVGTVQAQRKLVKQSVWPTAWRSGLGVMTGFGVVQGAAIAYASVGTASEVASLMLALRIIQVCNLLSQAPFYSRLPALAHLWAGGDRMAFGQVAKRGMQLALGMLSILMLLAGWLAPYLLELISSETAFVTPNFWSLLMMGMFFERYGSMHLQIHSSGGVILWHWANIGSGVLFIAVNLILFRSIGIWAYPWGYLLANCLFYAGYCAWHSYRLTKIKFVKFEANVSIAPLSLVLLFILVPRFF